MYQFSTAALGGTFDRLHTGHKAFLRSAFDISKHVVLGLTSDTYVKEHKHVQGLSFHDRKKELEAFFRIEGVQSRVTVVPIDRNEIPRKWQEKVQAIFVTEDTLIGATTLNMCRLKQKLSPLPIVLFQRIKNAYGDVISSTNIRSGVIDRTGNRYFDEKMWESTYILPSHLRQQLKAPLGTIVQPSSLHIKNVDQIVTVGDITTSLFFTYHIQPSIAVIDFVVERKKTYSSISELGFSGNEQVYQIKNPQSHIVPEVFIVLSHLFSRNEKDKNTSILQIVGEEDLIVLPVILLAPLGARVYYGQPQTGTVETVVTEELKNKMRELLSQFEKK